MAEPVRSSALQGHLHAGEHGVRREGGPGVVLGELRPQAICQVNGTGAPAELARALAGFGLGGVPAPRKAWSGERARLLWNGPGQWLAVADTIAPRVLLSRLREALAGSDATVTDLSHSRTVLRVAGPMAVELLLKGCPLDLEAMVEDDSATSVLGALTVHLHCRGGAGFDVYVYRSFGLALLQQLEEGALEFGLRIEAQLPVG